MLAALLLCSFVTRAKRRIDSFSLPTVLEVMTENEENYLYSIEIEIGTPPQKSQFLIDLQSSFTFVFSTNSSSLNYPIDSFYDPEDSTTVELVGENFFWTTTGFAMLGALY